MRIVLLLVLTLSPCLLQAEPPAAKPAKQTALRISPETTFIVEPLDEHGFVDYVAAVNQRMSKDLKPEDNYEAAVRQIVSVGHIPESIRKEYFERLGIEAPARKVDAISFETGFRKAVKQHAVHGTTDKQFDFVQNNLWNAKDFPQVATWLRQENERLNQLVVASRRPRNYLPFVCPEQKGDGPAGPRLIGVMLPSAQYQRDFVRAFAIRINGNIAAGELEAAWTDIMATMRIGRLNASGVTLVRITNRQCDRLFCFSIYGRTIALRRTDGRACRPNAGRFATIALLVIHGRQN